MHYLAIVLTFTLLPLAAPQFAAETQTGIIVTVGPHELTITTADNQLQKFLVAADALITLNDHPAKLDDLQPHQRVTLVTERQGEQFIAQRIQAFTNAP